MMVLKLSGNGSSLVIQNTSFSSINIVHDSFYLNKVFHYPQVATNLLSINQIYQDNDCYFIIIGIDFYVKENKTRRLLLYRLVEDSLYPINGNKSYSNNFRCLASKLGTKATTNQWYDRFSHHSKSILDYLSYYLRIKESTSKSSVYHSYQFGKAKRLSFNDSNKQSTKPLTLIHTDIWISISFQLEVAIIMCYVLMISVVLHGCILCILKVS